MFRRWKIVPARIALHIHHDEDAEVYLNGKKVISLGGYTTDYESTEIPSETLRKGENILAIHCHQNGGGQYIDVGFDEIVPVPNQVPQAPRPRK